jgi:hypothetical protein
MFDDPESQKGIHAMLAGLALDIRSHLLDGGSVALQFQGIEWRRVSPRRVCRLSLVNDDVNWDIGILRPYGRNHAGAGFREICRKCNDGQRRKRQPEKLTE